MRGKVEAAQRTGHGKRTPLTDYEQILRDIYFSHDPIPNIKEPSGNSNKKEAKNYILL